MKKKSRWPKRFVWRTDSQTYRDLERMAYAKHLSVNQQINAIVMTAIVFNDSVTKKKGANQ